VRNNDPSILPELGKPFQIRDLSEREGLELADALLENDSVAYLEFDTGKYTKSSAEAMVKYVRSSNRLQRIRWKRELDIEYQGLRQAEEIVCCFLSAFQESASIKELAIDFSLIDGSSNLVLENMLTHTQSLRSLSLIWPVRLREDIAVAAVSSGLKKNTTLRELTLEVLGGAMNTVSTILTSLRDHPLLRRLYLRGYGLNLTGLETLLLSDTSKITELEIHELDANLPMRGLTHVLHALARRPTLTKLGLRCCPLGRDEARLIRLALRNMPSLHSLALAGCILGSAGLVELAPALNHNTSIKELDISYNGLVDMSGNNLIDMESAGLLRDIFRHNKTITTLDLSGNTFGHRAGASECIADGLGSNSTLLKIDISHCYFRDDDIYILAQRLGSRKTTLKKLTLGMNAITITGVGVLLEAMEQSSHRITDLDLQRNPIGNEGASLLARSLGNNALPNLTRLSLSRCGIGDDGFIALLSALEQNTSLVQLDLRYIPGFTERTFLALAESLPEMKVLQQIDSSWCTGLASAMALLLIGLRKNTSLFRIHVTDCAPSLVPPTTEETARCAGSWMQEMERLGYRNRFLALIRAPKEKLPPRGVWPRALARVATLPDVIFEVLRSKPSLVPSEDTYRR
jgi:Ran GTPase-activating protein (RanGAP) involved in mRNA processing and transport